ncbi:retrovirus-related Pol polyprotein from transposon 17.6 [Nephila pilipes]|uniref:Retrovirus-related Pol polyprotein from transposon 17.6 n=1 Tax=Nephila pilipes TaxID=299642 RepID=A0A8X6T243_NEPPI|nr:retrovirus-related Pol polyprotein from transposon 17.6 [Nephila pilipes]
MHVNIKLEGIQLTALCDTGSQATLINEKTHRRIGSSQLHPSQIMFSGIGRDTVKSIGYFQESIEIQNNILPVKINVLKVDMITPDVVIGIDFLQQTSFTFDKDGIHLCNSNSCEIFVNFANISEDEPFHIELSHILNPEIRKEVQNIVTSYKSHKAKDTEIKMTILLHDEILVAQRSRNY